MPRFTIWDPNKGDRTANMPLTNNYGATAAPTVSNDSTQGYEVGSQWVNTSTGTAYTCLDATAGAAVWVIDSNGSGLSTQGAPVAHDTAATLTAADLLAGLMTSNPAGAINLQLPLATAMDTALPKAANNNSIDFSIINTNGANAPTVTTNTGWTLVGTMAVAANTSGRFRARKTGAGAWTLYRIS